MTRTEIRQIPRGVLAQKIPGDEKRHSNPGKAWIALLTEDSAFGSNICNNSLDGPRPALCRKALKLTFPVNIAALRSMKQEQHHQLEARLRGNPFASRRQLPLEQANENGSK